MTDWTTDWPTEPGWYWTYQADHRKGDVRPAEVVIGGQPPREFIVRLRDGVFLYKEEHRHEPAIWWTKLEGRPKPPTPLAPAVDEAAEKEFARCPDGQPCQHECAHGEDGCLRAKVML